MKILVIYFSQTGNTEKVAVAIHEEALKSNEAELMKLEDTDPAAIGGYDFIFIGSPLHAGSLASPVQDFFNAMQLEAGTKIACFITHAAPAYPDQDMEKFTEPVQVACDRNRWVFAGSFDCQGFLTEQLHEMIKSRQGATDAQWAEKVEQMSGHPDQADIEKARRFVRAVLEK